MKRFSATFAVLAMACSMVVLAGCRRAAQESAAPLPVSGTPLLEPGKFDALYRSIKTLEAAATSDLTYPRFRTLLQTAARELEMAKLRVKTDADNEIINDFGTIVGEYIDAGTVWQQKNAQVSSGDHQRAIMVGFFNSDVEWPTFEPIVDKYHLPVTIVGSGMGRHRSIPDDSYRRIWAMAAVDMLPVATKYLEMQNLRPATQP